MASPFSSSDIRFTRSLARAFGLSAVSQKGYDEHGADLQPAGHSGVDVLFGIGCGGVSGALGTLSRHMLVFAADTSRGGLDCTNHPTVATFDR